jgi:alkylation response protein AidB-like acyl-CoA dehydrogenase
MLLGHPEEPTVRVALTERQLHVVFSAVRAHGGHGWHQDEDLQRKLLAAAEAVERGKPWRLRRARGRRRRSR